MESAPRGTMPFLARGDTFFSPAAAAAVKEDQVILPGRRFQPLFSHE
jgi:hypothetical protein